MTPVADLRAVLGPIQDQGRRPTCLSFAVSAAHRGARSHPNDFSAECLHALSARILGTSPDDAVSPQAMGEALHSEGQVEEQVWPYGSAGPSPADAQKFKAMQGRQAFDLAFLKEELCAGNPVVVALAIGEEFFTMGGQTPPLRALSSPIQGHHAVVIVGLSDSPDGPLFLLRNSWGQGWGNEGYAWAHTGYLQASALVCLTYKGFC